MSVSLPPERLDAVKRTAEAERAMLEFRKGLKKRHGELAKGIDNQSTVDATCWWYWKAVRAIWTSEDFYVHPWAVKTVRKLCELNRRVAMFGAKQTSKSTTMASFMLILYWAHLERKDGEWKATASIIYRTTTLEEAEQRGWGEVQRLFQAAKANTYLPGHYVRSQPPKIVASETSTDKKKAILMKPIKSSSKGDGTKSNFGNIKGFHADVQLVIDDELNEMPDNASSAPKALDAPYKIFWYVGIGNPTTWTDPLGRMGSPTEIEIDDVYDNDIDEWKVTGGVCLRFAAHKSPNIGRPLTPDGEEHYKHLPGAEFMNKLIQDCGGDNHPDVWQFGLALPCPDSLQFTILSEVLVRQTGASLPASWGHLKPTLGAALDPAFVYGGDDCIVQFFQWGRMADGGWAIEFLDHHKIKLILDDKEMFFHVANEFKRIATARGVRPENACFDSTGTGLGLVSIIAREWSTKVVAQSYSGNPTKNPFSVTDQRPSTEMFDRRVSEIVWGLRAFVEHSQVRGLHGDNEQILKEAYSRSYERKHNVIIVETKDSIYQRNSSCDRMDAACLACDLLRQRGFMPGGMGGGSKMSIERQRQVPVNAAALLRRNQEFVEAWQSRGQARVSDGGVGLDLTNVDI